MLRLESCPLAANNRLARVSVLSDGIDSGGFTAHYVCYSAIATVSNKTTSHDFSSTYDLNGRVIV